MPLPTPRFAFGGLHASRQDRLNLAVPSVATEVVKGLDPFRVVSPLVLPGSVSSSIKYQSGARIPRLRRRRDWLKAGTGR